MTAAVIVVAVVTAVAEPDSSDPDVRDPDVRDPVVPVPVIPEQPRPDQRDELAPSFRSRDVGRDALRRALRRHHALFDRPLAA